MYKITAGLWAVDAPHPNNKNKWALWFIPLLLLLVAWVVSKLWFWFVVPYGFPVISFPSAIGLWLLLKVLTVTSAPEPAPDTDWLKRMVGGVFFWLFVLATGWVAHCFI